MFTFLMGIGLTHLLVGAGGLTAAGLIAGSVSENKKTAAAQQLEAKQAAQLQAAPQASAEDLSKAEANLVAQLAAVRQLKAKAGK
jgi:hypothetical protein